MNSPGATTGGSWESDPIDDGIRIIGVSARTSSNWSSTTIPDDVRAQPLIAESSAADPMTPSEAADASSEIEMISDDAVRTTIVREP